MRRLRSWWQRTRKPPVVIGFIAALVVVVLISLEVVFFGTGFAGKTLWDWLQLLIIPLVLAAGGYLFTFTLSRNERKAAEKHNQTEREIAQDNQREAAWQEYLDKMSELLLNMNLGKSTKGDEVREVARIRTLTVLHRLDADRKRSVLQFLYESGLISRGHGVINLHGANFRTANLNTINLTSADLKGADLSGANLSQALLWGCDLEGVLFNNADMSGAQFSLPKMLRDLRDYKIAQGDIPPDANLFRADLIGADLSNVNLSGINVTSEQLAKAASLKGATMPDGSIHP